MMRRGPGIAIYVIGFLAGLGILVQFAADPTSILIPLIVFGVIFLLWKFPPRTWKHGGPFRNPQGRTRTKTASSAGKSRRAKFRVIEGNKGKPRDEEPPPYH
jgi:hypothetical protein